ncbi:glycerate kinase-like isoform X2 [Homarus americanus]|uniref:glycerate kinase-like isoform X2 n=1 Tax=Homarus americanus TaxID=6706 RepID=UPI001C454A67|nr:glycerate kinase-like isoform X2 [Homarus americanus]
MCSFPLSRNLLLSIGHKVIHMKSLTMAAKVGCNLQENITRIKEAFMGGVNAVQPHELIRKHITQDSEKLVINGIKFDLQQNVYMIGFGKAVIGMVRPIERALTTSDGVTHLKRGIISVPFGIQETFINHPDILPEENSLVEIVEGAKDNIPDEAAFTTAKRIVSLVKKLGEKDILLVLISGGGSALLPYPIPPLSLNEKIEIIKSLSQAGASITDLNTVRKVLSVTKGGGLAELTKTRIISLILSDIINSPLDMIASGPTVCNRDAPQSAEKVLEKYNISTPGHIKAIIKGKATSSTVAEFSHVTNYIIGSNKTALLGVETSLFSQTGSHCYPLILSSSLRGEASEIGRKMAELVVAITQILGGKQDDQLSNSLLSDLCVDVDKKKAIIDTLEKIRKFQSPIWLVFGGETTVTVTGSGRGGRNQEMVLSASVALEEKLQNTKFVGEVIFLSGGTDGIDGPTDAAGALTYWCSSDHDVKSQLQEARQQGLSPENFLGANDSYSYFTSLSSSQYLLKPGHTGTNVMDLQILFIKPNFS